MRRLVDARRGDWMQTYTGRQFWPQDPRPEEVFIEDVAHACALTNRYKGHSLRACNLAEHQVRVSYFVRDAGGGRRTQLGALLHDAHEVFDGIGDVVGHLKESMPPAVRTWYKSHVRRVEVAIFDAFGVSDVLDDEEAMSLIKFGDRVLLATEARDNMAPPPAPWAPLPAPLAERIVPMSAEAAETWYLRRFRELGADFSSLG